MKRGPYRKRPKVEVTLYGDPCPYCGAVPKLTRSGRVPDEWLMTYGHRAPDGEPCRGAEPVVIVENKCAPRRFGQKRGAHAA